MNPKFFKLLILISFLNSCIDTSTTTNNASSQVDSEPTSKSNQQQGIYNFVVQRSVNIGDLIESLKPDRIEITSGMNFRKTISGDDLIGLKKLKVNVPGKGQTLTLNAYQNNKKLFSKVIK